MNILYILDKDKNIIPVDDSKVWADWFERSQKDKSRIVKQETINDKFISTVFLGTPYGFDEDEPLFFETMVFDENEDEWLDYQVRYSTYDQTLEGHEKAVHWVKDGCKDEET